jgi:hypothetical protein
MCDAHKIGFNKGLKISDRVMKKTIGFRKEATSNGSINEAA